jgi:hypothetical protein
MTTDPNMMVPQEIMDAAMLVDNWMHTNGHHTWELLGLCSRNHAYQLSMLHNAMQLFYAVIEKDWMCHETPDIKIEPL